MKWLLCFILTGCAATVAIQPLPESRSLDYSVHKRKAIKKASPTPKPKQVPVPPDPRLRDITEVIKKKNS